MKVKLVPSVTRGAILDIRFDQDCLIISPQRTPRQGWEKAFQSAGTATQDRLLLNTVPPNDFDREEWQWLAPAFS